MERRTRKATVRLTEEELARLKEAARRAGWSQEAYLRALIGGIDPRPKARPTSGSSRAWAPPSSTPPTPARPSGSCT